jgi:hypothetical protein
MTGPMLVTVLLTITGQAKDRRLFNMLPLVQSRLDSVPFIVDAQSFQLVT